MPSLAMLGRMTKATSSPKVQQSPVPTVGTAPAQQSALTDAVDALKLSAVETDNALKLLQKTPKSGRWTRAKLTTAAVTPTSVTRVSSKPRMFSRIPTFSNASFRNGVRGNKQRQVATARNRLLAAALAVTEAVNAASLDEVGERIRELSATYASVIDAFADDNEPNSETSMRYSEDTPELWRTSEQRTSSQADEQPAIESPLTVARKRRPSILDMIRQQSETAANVSTPATPPASRSAPTSAVAEKAPLLRRMSQGATKELEAAMATQYDSATSGVTGFMIDLDGTMYDPAGLLPGAAAFYSWLVQSGTPFVFLSNTGAKNSSKVQAKFGSAPYMLPGDEPVPLKNIHTAAEAQVDYLLENVPEGAKVLVISGGAGSWRKDLHTRGGEKGVRLVETWTLRTALTEEDAKAWAAASALGRASKSKAVWVVFFNDGEIGSDAAGGAETESFSDWGFELIKLAGFLLSHGAQFIYTADDAYNPSVDPRHPGLVFPLPGPGMFAAMMRKLMYPHGKDCVACAGKGGNVGNTYMMERARQMLIAQGHSGDPEKICMVGGAHGDAHDDAHAHARHPIFSLSLTPLLPCAFTSLLFLHSSRMYFPLFSFFFSSLFSPLSLDLFFSPLLILCHPSTPLSADRFDTDVRAGVGSGFLTCLVTSGCHTLDEQEHYRTDPAHFHASGVGDLVPAAARAAMPKEFFAAGYHGGGSGGSTFVAAANGPCSLQEAVSRLQTWVLLQSSSLARGSTADGSSRDSLEPILKAFFVAIDEDGNGSVDEGEVRRACEQVGISQRHTGGGVGGAGRPSGILEALSVRAAVSADGKLTYDQFASAVTGALAECGFDARRQWRKLAVLNKHARLAPLTVR